MNQAKTRIKLYGFLIAAAIATNSYAEEKAVVELTGSYTGKKTLKVDIKVEPIDGYKITLENAPWTLILDGNETDLKKTQFSKEDFASNLPNSSVDLKLKTDNKLFRPSYKLISFICTKDQLRCFREVYTGVVK